MSENSLFKTNEKTSNFLCLLKSPKGALFGGSRPVLLAQDLPNISISPFVPFVLTRSSPSGECLLKGVLLYLYKTKRQDTVLDPW
jgi:hypothetical protein